MQSPGKYWHNNVDGTAALVEAAMRAGVRDVVFSSSCSVYGTPASVPVARVGADRPGERVRRQQGDGRADPALVRRHQGLALGEPALLQRRRRQPRRRDRRGLDVLHQPHPAGDEGRARRRPAGPRLRQRLPDARRHVHPRLHPRRGPRRRPHPGARPCSRPVGPTAPLGRRQPRDGHRVVRARRDPGDRSGRRATGSARGRRPAGRGSGRHVCRPDRTPSPCSAGGPSRASTRSSRPPIAGTRRADARSRRGGRCGPGPASRAARRPPVGRGAGGGRRRRTG